MYLFIFFIFFDPPFIDIISFNAQINKMFQIQTIAHIDIVHIYNNKKHSDPLITPNTPVPSYNN